MLKGVLKSLLFLTATAVAIPYTTALLSNVLYGWPQKKNKFRRAFHPRKVLALNYTLLQLIYRNFKYIPLALQWKMFYQSTDPRLVRKNIVYGRNEQTMDLYLPHGSNMSALKPVVMFVYGGAWSGGNKKMYGMLCTQIANKLQAVVCCPNYSTHPQGYVDDMIQDVVDCVSWINENIADFGGNKDQLLLTGHSAGAHLCVMAVLELLHDELLVQRSGQSQLGLPENMPIEFEESYFDGNERKQRTRNDLDGSSGSSGSFCVLNDNGEKVDSLDTSNSASTYEFLSLKSETSIEGNLDSENISVETKDASSNDQTETTDIVKEISNDKDQTEAKEDSKDKNQTEVKKTIKEGPKRVSTEEEDVPSEDDSVVTVKAKELERHHTLIELGKSIKAVIGLAGVYHVGDHFQHESSRGIEDVSSMTRAMYGEEHFERFSPTSLCRSLSSSVSLPKIILLHGTEDIVVPVNSTTKFADVLRDIYADVTVRILPGCDHYEICLDIMKPGRSFHEPVMGVILETAARVFK